MSARYKITDANGNIHLTITDAMKQNGLPPNYWYNKDRLVANGWLVEERQQDKDNPDLEKYKSHRRSSYKRNIPFLLTFDEWLSIWKESGKYHLRGVKKGCYQMARYGDKGVYEVGNVFIQLGSDNARDAVSFRDNSYKKNHPPPSRKGAIPWNKGLKLENRKRKASND